ncbi:glycerophosphoryl diester phosphodiesterase [Kipferlia bialata]|uniref:Glycerophosphoryl diester phosphodiesterase n=1 Tax=Kipferlia bialata TaxID=797122 RepID=A0A9K3D1F4_9EUKA|nr:glycerophosphoryl diester phosphodiesterase [Kipferlia bialata]|eukprot:g8381.t1
MSETKSDGQYAPVRRPTFWGMIFCVLSMGGGVLVLYMMQGVFGLGDSFVRTILHNKWVSATMIANGLWAGALMYMSIVLALSACMVVPSHRVYTHYSFVRLVLGLFDIACCVVLITIQPLIRPGMRWLLVSLFTLSLPLTPCLVLLSFNSWWLFPSMLVFVSLVLAPFLLSRHLRHWAFTRSVPYGKEGLPGGEQRFTLGLLSFYVLLSLAIFLISSLSAPLYLGKGGSVQIPVFAHGCAGAYGAENTLEGIQHSYKRGARAVEIDVRMNEYGDMYLMHDSTLTRTTDVKDVYPDRASDPSDSFTIEEMAQLDAGSYYAVSDPFGAIEAGIDTQSYGAVYAA